MLSIEVSIVLLAIAVCLRQVRLLIELIYNRHNNRLP